MDIGLNENFDVELDQRNDVPLVTKRDAFEQALRIRLTDRFNDLIGRADVENSLDLLEVEADRVANEMDILDNLTSIQIEPSEDQPNVLTVDIQYETGDLSQLSLSE